MKSAVETLTPTRVKLTVEVPFEELKPSIDAAFKEISTQISVPGFRPGRVPARLIEQRVGRGAVIQEAVNHALPEFYSRAVDEAQVHPLGQPEVDITDVPAEGDGPLNFTVEVDVRPEIALPDFSAVSVTVDVVDDAAIETAAAERMTELQQRFKTLVGVERVVEDGDFVSIDLSAEIDGEEIDSVKGVSYEVGSGTMLDGLDEALIGMAAEETKTFETPLAGGEHGGEEAEVTVTVGSVKIAELPDLDDDFAQLASEYDTLEELRTDLREQAGQAKRLEQGVQARDRLLEQLLESLDVPLPESVVADEVNGHLESEGKLDDDEHRAEVDESTRSALKTTLVLDALAQANEVQVSQQELIEYLIMTAQQSGADPAELARMMDERQQVGAMVAEITRRKALTAVLEQITVTDTAGEAVDLTALIGGGPEEEDSGAESQLEETAGEAAESTAPADQNADSSPVSVSEPAAEPADEAAAQASGPASLPTLTEPDRKPADSD